ncbi:MAG: hypothetical protein HY784_14980 [Chloroflexi bacterium]|nr:hypothetical protein [Chloroflexota bacterium]
MATAEERKKILKMIEEGKISAEDGARLLSALSGSEGRSAAGAGALPEARWLRIRVTDSITGKAKVSVNVPTSLVDMAIKMGARFAPEIEGFELQQVIEALKSGSRGKIIDVVDEEGGEKVEIYLE